MKYHVMAVDSANQMTASAMSLVVFVATGNG